MKAVELLLVGQYQFVQIHLMQKVLKKELKI
jgi:hypothetical protein